MCVCEDEHRWPDPWPVLISWHSRISSRAGKIGVKCGEWRSRDAQCFAPKDPQSLRKFLERRGKKLELLTFLGQVRSQALSRFLVVSFPDSTGSLSGHEGHGELGMMSRRHGDLDKGLRGFRLVSLISCSAHGRLSSLRYFYKDFFIHFACS